MFKGVFWLPIFPQLPSQSRSPLGFHSAREPTSVVYLRLAHLAVVTFTDPVQCQVVFWFPSLPCRISSPHGIRAVFREHQSPRGLDCLRFLRDSLSQGSLPLPPHLLWSLPHSRGMCHQGFLSGPWSMAPWQSLPGFNFLPAASPILAPLTLWVLSEVLPISLIILHQRVQFNFLTGSGWGSDLPFNKLPRLCNSHVGNPYFHRRHKYNFLTWWSTQDSSLGSAYRKAKWHEAFYVLDNM